MSWCCNRRRSNVCQSSLCCRCVTLVVQRCSLRTALLCTFSTHCMLYRQALATQDLNEELHSVLNYMVKIINFVKANHLNTHLFRILCEEMGPGHENVLLHSEVRWLSKGKVVKRVYELREELKEFLQQRDSPLSEHLTDSLFIWLTWRIYFMKSMN